MAHPKGGYRNAAGKKIPGTTTIIGRFKDSGGLLWWAFGQGKDAERRSFYDLIKKVHPKWLKALFGKEAPPAIYNLYDKRDEAADIGTLAHSMVEAHIKGEVLPKDVPEQAQSAFDAYLKWESMTKLKIVEQEMSLISEVYQFGGTPDAIGEIDGELCLIDWKTSKGVYQDMLIQLAAYRLLWHENYPKRQLSGGSHLCRFSKEHGDFSHHYWPNLDDAQEQFLLFRLAYDLDKRLKARAA